MKSETRKTLWWHTAEPAPKTGRLDGAMTVDVAIVGAGFTGLTAALHLAGRGASLAVLEAGILGAGASGLNAGFVVPNFAKADPATVLKRLGEKRGEALLQLVGGGAERVFRTARDHAIACDAAQTGWLQAAHCDDADATAQARADQWRALGQPVEHMDGAAIGALIGFGDYCGGFFDRSGGTIHPLSYLRGLARVALDKGATIFENTMASGIARAGRHWELSCSGGVIRAEQVFLCTNAVGEGVGQRLSKSVVPLAVYQIATEPLAAEIVRRVAPHRMPMSDMRANLFTCRLDRDDRLISGGMAIVPIGAHQRMARSIVARLARNLALSSVPKVDYVWRGVAAITPDFLPHLFQFGPGLIGAIGCNGRGIAMTAALGEVLADAAGGTDLANLPVPVADGRGIPFHALAGLAASAGYAQALWQDWRAGNAR